MSEERALLEIGTIIDERFEILEHLGAHEGGGALLAKKIKAKGERNSKVVLKYFTPPLTEHETIREHFAIAKKIKHRFIARAFEVLEHESELLCVMEYVKGETLESHLAQRRAKGESLSVEEGFQFAENLCTAAQVIHQSKLVHGVLTPEHIFITPRGRIKIHNLVFAQVVQRRLAESEKGLFFSSPYTPPEAKNPNQRLTPAADVYSLGVLAADMISATSAADVDPSKIVDFITKSIKEQPEHFQSALLSAVLPDPVERPQSAEIFQAYLESVLQTPEESEAEETEAKDDSVLVLDDQSATAASVPKRPPTPRSGVKSAAGRSIPRPRTGEISRPRTGEIPRPRTGEVPRYRSGEIPRIKRTGEQKQVNAILSGDVAAILSGDMPTVDLPESKTLVIDFNSLTEPTSSQEIDFRKTVTSADFNIVGDGKMNMEQAIWIVRTDEGDQGPFNGTVVLEMLYDDRITEYTEIQNIDTPMLDTHRLGDIRLFHDSVLSYIPSRNARLADDDARREQLKQRAKAASAVSGLGMVAFFIFSIATGVIAYLNLPQPEPTEFASMVEPFPKAFAMSKVEKVEIDVDANKLRAMLDPTASAEERRKQEEAWIAEMRKKRQKKRRRSGKKRSRKSRSGAAGAAEDEDPYIATFSNSDDEPLDDFEIEEMAYGRRMMNKVRKCIEAHPGQASSVKVSFWIRTNGRLTRVKAKSKKHGAEYEGCVKRAYLAVSFRSFGGSDKHAAISYEF